MEFALWLGFVLASLALLIAPGPTVILVASYAMTHGRTVALATAAGVAAGDFVAMSTSLLGLGALVLASAELFVTLKWIGAAYLAYLGVRLLLARPGAGLGEVTAGRAVRRSALFGHAFTVTALNPKSIVFFIAFVPQFIRPEAPLAPQFAILIATFVTLAALNAVAYALLADRLRARLARPAVALWLGRAGGAVLVALGVLTAATRRAA